MKTEKTTVALKKETIKKLDEIAKLKIEEALKNGTLDINTLVRKSRGISYDDEINYLSEFYLFLYKEIKKIPLEKIKQCKPLEKIIKKSKKICKILEIYQK